MKNLLFTGLTLLTLALATPVSAQSAKTKSFAQWCQQKDTLPANTKLTIDVLLKTTGTQNCKKADRQLKSLTELKLSNTKISDLQPLSGLTNLKKLQIDDNQISDLKPLARLTNLQVIAGNRNQITSLEPLMGLTNLKFLSFFDNKISNLKPLRGLTKLGFVELSGNQIVDVTSLSGLTNLNMLSLSRNQISDVIPLSGLTNLSLLALANNQIVDVKPLTGFGKLGMLLLANNQIVDVKPLAGLNELFVLLLANNQIVDIKPLAGLNKNKTFGTLDLTNNPIAEKICPLVRQPSPCKFSGTSQAQANTPALPKKLLRTLEVPSRVKMTALSRDRQTLVTAQEGSITVWNLATGTSRSHTLLDSQYATITALAISPDGRTLITGSSGLDIQEVSKNSGCSGWSCESSQGSSRIKSEFGCAIQFWEISTGRGIGMLKLSSAEQIDFLQQGTTNFSQLRQLEFSSDGKILWTQGNEGRILAWEYASGARKPGVDTAYPPAKVNYAIETSWNEKTTKIDIYAID